MSEARVPVGYAENTPGVLTPDTSPEGTTAAAADLFALVPAVGHAGNAAPLQTFAEQLWAPNATAECPCAATAVRAVRSWHFPCGLL